MEESIYSGGSLLSAGVRNCIWYDERIGVRNKCGGWKPGRCGWRTCVSRFGTKHGKKL